MKKINIIIVWLMSVVLVGCMDDFLDTKQKGVTTVEDFFTTEDEILQGILGCYDWIQISFLTQEFTPLFMYTLMSDEVYAGGYARGSNFLLEELNEFRFGSNNNMFMILFDNCYRGIYRCNVILEQVDDSTPFNRMVRAEAKAIRAFWHFHLVVNWGDVPLITRTLNPSEYAQPRTPAAEVWTQIETDLLEAITELPLRSEQEFKARLSKGAVQALLGKAYLYQKKYEEAATELRKVIDSDQYKLYDNYADIIKKESELCSESVFEITQALSAYSRTSSPPRIPGLYTGEASKWMRDMGPQGDLYFDSGNLEINSGFNYCTAQYAMYQAFVDAGDFVRRNATVISEDELIANYNGKMRNNGKLAWATEPCLRLKYTLWKSETGPPQESDNYGTNVRLIRYSDVLLMAAEAYNRQASPNDALARSYVNIVRDRAELPELPTNLTGDALFKAIKNERQLELMFEGHRLHDLIRWGDAETVLANQGKLIPKGDGTYLEVPGAGFKAKNKLFPIPEQEMEVNKYMKQNPEY